ncbi:uncharacterized protein PHALS_08687 [Plasmopara halstedii]|uniref:Uncharacterized protein n=1 Tax=Plasmopara halstedii TaxID=4781 RepID=A0A0P1AE53_PLAHL|nr:uncharacterized protein PHALS_08687 [Plasmopara halstedii]CEG38625.1 hypothetical protein PHALS_08687 [Plasmopara halstedii]|eukprot:XP_024574994.1 hypothetical protein PHALS_08687 [Plasmopara halstedii]
MAMMLDDRANANDERGRAIVQTLAVVVESMVHASDRMPIGYYHKTKFEAFRAPGISVSDYLARIHNVVLAAKFFDDHYFNNAYYAKPTREL